MKASSDNKDLKEKSLSSPKGGEKASPKKDKSFKLNDPNTRPRRQNRILNDGKDWFDTHPDWREDWV